MIEKIEGLDILVHLVWLGWYHLYAVHFEIILNDSSPF